MGQIRNENIKESPMTRFGGQGTPDDRSRRLRSPAFPAAEWAAKNPLLQLGEVGYETDTHKTKIGDGVTAWNDLPYVFDDVGANTNLSNLTATGKANISAVGTYDASATYASGTIGAAIKDKADAATSAKTDLSNLTSAGKNIANWSSNVTNCITEIPQDIKLELSGGTLTLKSGSKLYKPNGVGNFDAITTTVDKTATQTVDGKWLVFYNEAGDLNVFDTGLCVSGDTDSLAGQTWHTWYDTTNNIIKNYGTDPDTVYHTYSLPLAVITTSNGAISSIDQIFNGFGYIGSTIFALPGVSGLMPNGRNTDGTLKSTMFTVSGVKTYTNTNSYTNVIARIYQNGTMYWSGSSATYNPDTNYNMIGSTVEASCFFGRITSWAGGQIVSFDPKTVFRAVDYSDTDFIAHQAMPSGRYTNLTLPATGGTITAPADGYLTVNKSATAAGQYIDFINGSNGMNCNEIAPSALPLRLCMPVSKGDVITINYDADGTTTMFRFIYTNGVK